MLNELTEDETKQQLQNVKLQLINLYSDYFDFMRAYKKDKSAVNFSFNCLTDDMNKSGELSDGVTNNITLEATTADGRDVNGLATIYFLSCPDVDGSDVELMLYP
jgi:hypothetical protein